MSGPSAFIRCNCGIKSENSNRVSTPSIFIVCEIETLMREQDKTLSIRVSALPNSFLLMSLFRESIWYVGDCSAFDFGSSCLVTDCVVTLLVYTEAGTRTNCFISRLMTGSVMTANSCNPFSDNRTFLLCFQVVLFSNSNQTSS